MTNMVKVMKEDIEEPLYRKIARTLRTEIEEQLQPGDIIATGTPSGVGYSRTPPEFLKSGDMMETEIESIGLLRNPIL